MDIDIVSLINGLWKNSVSFYSTSVFVSAIKFFLFVYVVVLFADIVMLLMLRGISSDIKKTLYGAKRPILSKSKAIVRFETILARLESENPSQYKVAILEADAFAEEILAGIGYEGETMAEKLETVHEGQIESKALLVEAHLIRNRIVHEADFSLSYEETKKWLDAYLAFFHEVELF
ncbi:MAG: hypothetical protein AUK19_00910 [Candidatus Moranbacteria bacterium CG2_30_45_14]|nr:MAG: hypothetical protein AUK19_00910 [Candidatus Moranbacteria bacterium CG2_30_45_14]